MAEDLDGNKYKTPGWVNAIKYCGCNPEELGYDEHYWGRVREEYKDRRFMIPPKTKTQTKTEPTESNKTLQKCLDDYFSKSTE